ncbi:MAG: metal-dependent hydrolase [Leptospiraceae bacterium]|nr:metal-dependent hydrolase [Leptospiraceae bacterium]
MATIVTHGIFASLLLFLWREKEARFRLALMIFFASILPDVDLFFPRDRAGIFYHRGITHSIFFAFVTGAVFSAIFLFQVKRLLDTIILFIIFTLTSLSHSFLDAMTVANDSGVCFFCPFSTERIMLPFQPFQTYSGGYSRGVGGNALLFMVPEIVFVWIPSLLGLAFFFYLEKDSPSTRRSNNDVVFKPIKIAPKPTVNKNVISKKKKPK